MQRLLVRFQRLSWKLTLSYTLVTVAALIVVELAGLLLAGLLVLRGDFLPLALTQLLRDQVAPQAQSYLEQQPPDLTGLQAYVQTVAGQGLSTGAGQQPQIGVGSLGPNDALLVVDARQTILAAFPRHRFVAGETLRPDSIPGLQTVLPRALAGEQRAERLYTRAQGDLAVIAVAVPGKAGVAGAVVLHVGGQPSLSAWPSILGGLAQLLVASALFFTVAAGLVGALFGLLTARGLSRRLGRLSEAAAAWSRGDFSVIARDASRDELGRLAANLNRMAEQLENLLSTRQELATLEERNRLARDLHDSVKQQVFAIGMQLGAARELSARDPAAASQHLAEAERLAQQAQRELTGLIRELRPAELAGRRLAPALRDYVESWSAQTGIRAGVRAEGEQQLALATEQALFRIAQEALANVARHSQAGEAEVVLQWRDDSVTMTIGDNGRGFAPAGTEERGMGLRSMRERIEGLGGAMAVTSAAGSGATLVFTCPAPKS